MQAGQVVAGGLAVLGSVPALLADSGAGHSQHCFKRRAKERGQRVDGDAVDDVIGLVNGEHGRSHVSTINSVSELRQGLQVFVGLLEWV